MQKDNLQRPAKGLHKDRSFGDQPKDTYRFALNAVNETELGDLHFLGNEESNEICDSLTPGYVPLGKVYISTSEVLIFSVSSDETISEIGILNDACNYSVYVNDADSSDDKLNFKVTHQIQGTYRLRRGCERTVYFTDDLNRPRYLNLDSLADFKNPDGTWNGKLFSLQKQYSKIPNFQDVEVIDSGGNLEPGGYSIAVQYVDDSLNPTEWITTSPSIKIYNDLSNKDYREINGSINSDTDYLDFPTTSKAIKVTLSNLDSDFLYYRLAFIESNNGSGLITNVNYTDVIPTSKNFFIYTGTNFIEEGTTEEIAQFSDIVYKAQSIEQIENRLLLGNTQGKQVNFCRLQRYASKIKTDVITKQVILSDITDPSNPKNPTHEFGGRGYMPGEIYSFGIVYIFADGSTSPVYHIPGKSNDINPDTVFSPGDNVYSMSTDNESSSTYTDNENCDDTNYWGRDSEGLPLVGKKIRHHRFPLRSDINKPLVVDEIGNQQNLEFYNLTLIVNGDLQTPIDCPDDTPDCGTDSKPSFIIRVNYKVDGEDFSFVENIDPAQFANGTSSYIITNLIQNGQFHGSNNITNISIEISDINGDFQDESTFDHSIYWNNTPTFTTEIKPFTSTVQGRVYTTEILGVKFSGVDVPTLEDAGGEEIVGYYIVRNERTEFDKTILDSGVLIPSVTNNKYISHGLLAPETNNISDTVYGLIHPEHKFREKEYVVYDELIQQGNFNVIDRKYSLVNYDDVYDGTSYNSDNHSDDNDDADTPDGSPTSKGLDGWSMNILARDNIVSFKSQDNFIIENDDIDKRFYLDALGTRAVNDNANDVYNVSTDNKVGIVKLKNDSTINIGNKLPYVVMKKNNLDSYSNFRILPYYKDTVNPFYFEKDTNGDYINNDISTVFGGDSYVSPMRYVNTTFWDNRVSNRSGKGGFFKVLLGAILVVLGAVLAILTVGASTLLIGAGIAIIGAGALFLSSGIKMNNVNRAFNEEYDKGLRQTTLDDWVNSFYNYKNNSYTNPGDGTFGFAGNGGHGPSGPTDDTIQWIGDCLTDLWFETSINTNLRNRIISESTPTFLNSPAKIESGNNFTIHTIELGDSGFIGIGNTEKDYVNSNSVRYPVSSLERHLALKLLAFDPERDDNRYYIGLALGEFYNVNLDYERYNQEKIYSHLPLEYDCCSECQEDFPHRIHYSEQSFQEELSDNYRIFLPNNYRDIQGETGEVTNIFKIGNNLFIHTLEGLWQMPRNYQERVTDQIISFVGTGSYFEIPPQKVLDDDTGSSAGLQHKWSAIKTPHGYFFVCENQRKIYQFTGKNLVPISSNGLNNWFKENLRLKVDETYYGSTGETYPYKDNPSNIFGSGFISTYDSTKERLIFTKKDKLFTDEIGDLVNYNLCVNSDNLTVFLDVDTTVATENAQGWDFVGVENCKMKFSKEEIKTRIETRTILKTIKVPNNADVIIQLDMSGSFNSGTRQQIKDAVIQWKNNFASSNPDWAGNLYFCEVTSSTLRSQRSWKILKFIEGGEGLKDISGNTVNASVISDNVIAVSFVNENDIASGPGQSGGYHSVNITNPISTFYAGFTEDYNEFINLYNTRIAAGGSFKGLIYPIVYSHSIQGPTNGFLQHAMAALKGGTYTASELNAISENTFSNNWSLLETALQASNPYPNDGLENYGWKGIWNRGWSGSGDIINAGNFQLDMTGFLEGDNTTVEEEIQVEVSYIDTTYKFIEGIVFENPISNVSDWTMSYSLKKDSWVSWHSYLPNFYINVPEKFYSWVHGNDNIWKHNKKGHYQTFYGQYYPHVIEFISLSTPVVTRIWNHLKFLTEAKKFDIETQEYFDERFKTFNKAILYNSRQCSGEMNLQVKDTQTNQQDYLLNQVVNSNDNTFIIDRNEKDWTLNDLRDIRIDYTKPIWNSNISSVQAEYYIDKILNTNTLDVNKDWTQLESFRDKYLAVRLIFDIFADTKLLTNYSVENEQQSFR